MEEFDRGILGQLATFYASNRGSGYTYACVKGVENTPNALLVVANEAQKGNTGLPREKQVSVRGRDLIISARRFALVPDNFVLIQSAQEKKNRLTTLTINQLGGLKEWAEGMKKDGSGAHIEMRRARRNPDARGIAQKAERLTENVGYNQALTDLITHIQENINSIENK